MIYSFGDFELDPASFELRRAGKAISVQRRVFDLLAYLVEHDDRLVTREDLFEHIWAGVAVTEASLAQAVKHARKALDDDAESPTFILTVRGRGYRFAGAVKRREIPSPRRSSEGLPQGRAAEGSFTMGPFRGPSREELVGRDPCMRLLCDGLEEAIQGRGGLVLVSGEPGIGKTRVLDELRATASARGARVLVGRCYEGGEGAPALWSWIQVLRAYGADDPEGVAGAARESSRVIAELLPELARHAHVAPVDPEAGAPPASSALRARFQLFDGITSVLRRAALDRPLVVLLDDLHRADEPSLLMLKFLTRALRDARILVVGAHRSLLGGAASPLRGVLAGLSREGEARGLTLEGLSEADVRCVLEARLGAPPAAELARAVHAQTGGNPFFLTQIARVLRASGSDAAGALAEVLRSPVGEAIRAQVEIFSARCQEVLAVASVFGGAFDLARLAEAAGLGLPEIIGAISEAAFGGIVVADDAGRGTRYRFVHALVRDALYAALPLPRRVELHGRVGDALAAEEDRGASPNLAQIAYHLLQAAPSGGTGRAASFAVRAAEEATRRNAHDDAVRLYERATEALDLGPHDAQRRVEVMLALGKARFRAGDLARSKEVFERSAKLARSLGDGGKLADAALGYALEEERSVTDKRRVAFLEEGLQAVAGGGETQRALLTARLAVAQYFAVDRRAREELARDAVATARRSGDPAALAYTLRCLHFVLLAPDTTEERRAVATELRGLEYDLDDREGELRALSCRIFDGLELSRITEVDADVEAFARIAAELGQPSFQWSAQLYRAGRALMTGPVDAAETLLGEQLSPTAAGGAGAGRTLALLFQIRKEQGRLGEIEAEVAASAARAPGRALRRSTVAFLALVRGDEATAAAELAAIMGADLSAIRLDLEWLATVSQLAELAAALRDAPRAAALHDALAPYAGRLVLTGLGAVCTGPVAHYLGLLAISLGRWGDAERHLDAAIVLCRAASARPFEIRSKLELAELCVARGEARDVPRARSLAAEVLIGGRSLGRIELVERASRLLSRAR